MVSVNRIRPAVSAVVLAWTILSLPTQTGAECGARGSNPLSEPEYLAARVSLERGLTGDEAMTHCEYSLRRACLDWEANRPDAGRSGFRMALRFCDDKSVAERGVVASALAREDFGEAYAAWRSGVKSGPRDSAAVAEYEPVVHSGLSLTGFPYHGPEAYRITGNPKQGPDPATAWRLSIIPGLGFLYVGEPKVAASHFALSAGFAALCGWSAWQVIHGSGRDTRLVAGMDFALVATLFLQRYYLGGMREAHRLAEAKRRKAGLAKVAAMADALDPFKESDRLGAEPDVFGADQFP